MRRSTAVLVSFDWFLPLCQSSVRHQWGERNPQEILNTVSREYKIPGTALSKKLQLIPFLFHFNAPRLPLNPSSKAGECLPRPRRSQALTRLYCKHLCLPKTASGPVNSASSPITGTRTNKTDKAKIMGRWWKSPSWPSPQRSLPTSEAVCH